VWKDEQRDENAHKSAKSGGRKNRKNGEALRDHHGLRGGGKKVGSRAHNRKGEHPQRPKVRSEGKKLKKKGGKGTRFAVSFIIPVS